MALGICSISCGVLQLYKLSNYYLTERRMDFGENKKEISAEDLVDQVKASQHDREFGLKRHPFIIFSDNIINSEGGKNLAKYIIENNLGEITESPSRNNPNHSSKIMIWIWTVDWNALDKWEP